MYLKALIKILISFLLVSCQNNTDQLWEFYRQYQNEVNTLKTEIQALKEINAKQDTLIKKLNLRLYIVEKDLDTAYIHLRILYSLPQNEQTTFAILK